MVVLGLIGLWPAVLAPLADLYVLVCANVLSKQPIPHHAPPLLVAFISPIVLIGAGSTGLHLTRQMRGQRDLARRMASRQSPTLPATRRTLDRLGLSGRVVLVEDERVFAFCAGLIRPRVYLSRGVVKLLQPAELEAILSHERHHIRRRDPLRFALVDVVELLWLAFPAVAGLAVRVRVRAEMDADRAAIATAGFEALASALLKVCRANPVADFSAQAAFSATDARIAAL